MVRWLTILAAAALLTGCHEDGPPQHGDIQWWREARYGMFVHFGPFSQWYNRDIVKAQSNQPPAGLAGEAYDRWFVEGLTPQRDCARHWAKVAKAAGMKYIVFTAKHHEGFCLWDSRVTGYNSTRMGPGFDMVAEYVKACREEGLRVGIYYSLCDGHENSCRASANDPAARRRMLTFTQALLAELMGNYGKVDILWYDGPTPMGLPGEWEAEKMTGMVRRMQPGILVNDRAMRAEDFTCPECDIRATEYDNQDWESCMPFRRAGALGDRWRWFPAQPETYWTAREIIDMLHRCTAGGGNLLLNVGPDPRTGRISDLEQERLATVGKWLQSHGEAVYGRVSRVERANLPNDAGGRWTRKGNVAYLWLPKWPAGGKVVLEGVHAKVLAATILTNGAPLAVSAERLPDTEKLKNASRVTIAGLPAQCPDAVCNYAILKLQFDSYPE